MKIFNKEEGWNSKVNFVDENNVLVGYDMSQCCCENADWFISNTPEINPYGDHSPDENLDDWVFDPEYFEEVDNYELLDCGGMVRFRLVNGDHEKFLHLYNVHNGYYSHSFTFEVGGVVIHEYSI